MDKRQGSVEHGLRKDAPLLSCPELLDVYNCYPAALIQFSFRYFCHFPFTTKRAILYMRYVTHRIITSVAAQKGANMRKTITVFLLMSMLASLPACNGKEAESTTNTHDTTATETTTQTESETETAADPLSHLDVVDMEGYAYRQLLRDNDSMVEDMIAEEQTGEIVNDAIFRRNTEIEERYNCTFTYTRSSDSNYEMDAKPGILANDDAYDWIVAHGRAAAGYANEGLALDWNKLKYIDLTKSWWDSDAVENFQLPGGIFWMVGDISYKSVGAASCMFFNKDFFTDSQIEFPYAAVKEGTWTFDAFSKIVQEYSRDLNGDGTIDDNDLYGYVTSRWSGPVAAFVTSGARVVTSAADGYQFNVYNERSIAMAEKFFALLKTDSAFLDLDGSINVGLFQDGHALFMNAPISRATILREMEYEFGILPWPKYDETSEYMANVDASTNMFVVPITNQVLDNTSLVLESLSILGRAYTIPAYYDVTLKTRESRDEESSAMIDIIVSHRVFDLGYYNLDLGGAYASHFAELATQANPDFASWYEKKLAAATAARDKVLAAYRERAGE